MFNDDYRFDIQLAKGQAHERNVAGLLQAERFEVKAELTDWLDTGNAFIEYYSRGKPSCMSVTNAEWWLHGFQKRSGHTVYVATQTDHLHRLCQRWGQEKHGVGQERAQDGMLLTLWSFFKEP